MRQRTNVLTLGDVVNVVCHLGVFNEVLIVGFEHDAVRVHLGFDLGIVPVAYSDIRRAFGF